MNYTTKRMESLFLIHVLTKWAQEDDLILSQFVIPENTLTVCYLKDYVSFSFFLFKDRLSSNSLFSWGWSWTPIHPASTSQELGFQECTTMLGEKATL